MQIQILDIESQSIVSASKLLYLPRRMVITAGREWYIRLRRQDCMHSCGTDC